MYDNVRVDGTLNFVTDLGADPTGSEPIDDALAALNSLRGVIKVIVPGGVYRLSARRHTLTAPENGVRILEAATGEQPRIRVPEGHRGPWLGIETNGAIRGIDIDRTAPDSSPELRIAAPSRFELADMTIQGYESLPPGVHGNGVISVASPADATIRLRNVRIPDGTAMYTIEEAAGYGEGGYAEGGYGQGETIAASTTTLGGAQPGVVVGPHNEGTVVLEDCQILHCSSHGVDAARSAGPVKIHGGRYENNNRSQLRLCGPGMEVREALVVVDLRASSIPVDEYARTAGIWNEALTPRKQARPPSGGVISRTTIAVRSGPMNSLAGAYYGSPLAGGQAIRGCDLIVDVGGVPAVAVDAPERVLDDYPPEEPLGIELAGSAFRGQARSGLAIEIEGRTTSSLRDSCIALPDQREGYALPRGVRVSNVNVGGRCTGPPRR